MARYNPEQFQRKLNAWSKKMPLTVAKALNRGAALIVREAKGHLRGPTSAGGGFANETLSRRSSRLFFNVNKRVRVLAGSVTARIGTNVPYGRIHEYGGWTGRNHASYIPRRPYLRPSIEKRRRATTKLILDEMMRSYRVEA